MARTDYTVGKLKIESDDMNNVTNASLTMNGENWDITAIGDDNPSQTEVTETFQISFTANYDAANAAQAAIRNKFIGGSRTLTSVAYYESDSKYISGSGVISSATLTKSVGSFDVLTGTIDSAGAWSYT